MTASERGATSGLDWQILAMLPTKERYEAAGKARAQKSYSRVQKQEEFLQGWMSEWQEPHSRDCQCEECQSHAALIDD